MPGCGTLSSSTQSASAPASGAGSPQDGEQSLEARELARIEFPGADEVVQVEEALLVLDPAGEFAVLHRDRRQVQGPGLARVVHAARAAIVAEDGAGPVGAGLHEFRCLGMVGGEFGAARPRPLRSHDRRRRNRGKRDNAHRHDYGNAAFGAPHDFNANVRTTSSPEPSTIRTRTPSGMGGSVGTVGQVVAQASPGPR